MIRWWGVSWRGKEGGEEDGEEDEEEDGVPQKQEPHLGCGEQEPHLGCGEQCDVGWERRGGGSEKWTVSVENKNPT